MFKDLDGSRELPSESRRGIHPESGRLRVFEQRLEGNPSSTKDRGTAKYFGVFDYHYGAVVK